ncbi:MAG: ABC transporter substrate-binding protein, partial [Pseudomonadota bacterium]
MRLHSLVNRGLRRHASRAGPWHRSSVRVLAAIPLFAAALLCGCGTNDAVDDAQRVYRHALDGRVDSVDPARAATVQANHLVVNIFDTLYGYRYLARPHQLKPNLAASMPDVSADGLTYTIRLKRGVYFIDDPAFTAQDGKGREVTADDVVYSMQRQLDPQTNSLGAWLWRDRLDSIEAVDRFTVRIRLPQPFPQLLHTLTQGFAAVVPREAVEFYGPRFGAHPVGSGPFMLESLQPHRAVLVANPNYRREPIDLAEEGYDAALHDGFGLQAIEGRSPPLVDRLEFWFVPEDEVRWGSYNKGDEVQYMRAPGDRLREALVEVEPPQLAPHLAGGHRALLVPAPEVVYHTFNFDFAEVGYSADERRQERNRLLRCALVRTYDWAARDKAFFDETSAIFPGVIPPFLPEYDGEAAQDFARRDVDEAKRLLREGGWNEENLPELVYGFEGTVRQQQIFEQFRAWALEIGYPIEKIKPKVFSGFAEFASALREGSLMMSLKGWSMDYPDAENILQLFYGPNRAPGSNDGNYANDAYDALYESMVTLAPGPERTRIVREMNQLLIDDCAVIAGLARTRLLMWHNTVILYPDRNTVGGYAMKFVALVD